MSNADLVGWLAGSLALHAHCRCRRTCCTRTGCGIPGGGLSSPVPVDRRVTPSVNGYSMLTCLKRRIESLSITRKFTLTGQCLPADNRGGSHPYPGGKQHATKKTVFT